MIIILGLLIAFILVLIFSRPALRHCRWRRHKEGDLVHWRCAFCGARTTTSDLTPPKTCFRNTP